MGVYSQEDLTASDYVEKVRANIASINLQWDFLNEEYSRLSSKNSEIEQKLKEAQLLTTELQYNLECALERISDAEDGAISLLDQNTELYNQNRQLERLTIEIRQEIGRMERRAALQPWVFTIGGAGFVVGGTFFGMGVNQISNDSSAAMRNMAVGGAIIGVDLLVYVAGRWIFKWW
jgi:predicted RNase H-like nuclease (RuvC/YqgF family)